MALPYSAKCDGCGQALERPGFPPEAVRKEELQEMRLEEVVSRGEGLKRMAERN